MYRLVIVFSLAAGMIAFSGCSKKTTIFAESHAGDGSKLYFVTLTLGKKGKDTSLVGFEESVSTTAIDLPNNGKTETLELKGGDWFLINLALTNSGLVSSNNVEQTPIHKGESWQIIIGDFGEVFLNLGGGE